MKILKYKVTRDYICKKISNEKFQIDELEYSDDKSECKGVDSILNILALMLKEENESCKHF